MCHEIRHRKLVNAVSVSSIASLFSWNPFHPLLPVLLPLALHSLCSKSFHFKTGFIFILLLLEMLFLKLCRQQNSINDVLRDVEATEQFCERGKKKSDCRNLEMMMHLEK